MLLATSYKLFTTLTELPRFLKKGDRRGGGEERERRQGENIRRENMGRKIGRKENGFPVFIIHSRRLPTVSEEGHNLAGPNGMAGSRDTVKY